MAEYNEASPICRGKNLTLETVLLFFNSMPRVAMPKSAFHNAIELKINGWTQTHSQIARQMAFYYEEGGICYPRFTKSSTLKDLVEYMQFWASNYFVPNPYTPSLAGRTPTNIYAYLKRQIGLGNTDFDKAFDSMLGIKFSSHDKIMVYLSNFTNLSFDGSHTMSVNDSIINDSEIKVPNFETATDNVAYFNYFTIDNTDNIRKQFEYFLRNCTNSVRRQGNQYRYGDSAVASFMSYMKADVLFASNREKWSYIKDSLFEITSTTEIDKVCDDCLNDPNYINFDTNRGQWGIKTLLIYNAFIHSKEYFQNQAPALDSLQTPALSLTSNNLEMPDIEERLGYPLQQIFYGAPGTGKSHGIEKLTGGHVVIRTTFHPDSDYSTFVGAYKPAMEKNQKKLSTSLSINDLAVKLSEYYNDPELGNIFGVQKFVYEYCPYLNGDLMTVNIKQLLQLAGISDNYNVEVNKYIKMCKLFPKQEDRKIVYKFIPQAFTQAYVKAWQDLSKPVFLVIEEINRGNCAQIFGDIFQLLDRKDNRYSSYAINPNEDIMLYLNEEFEAHGIDSSAPEEIKSGEKLCLPPNLFIWATMNTSDQSLFPIDSAFKRRWDWKYVPIDTRKEDWSIEANGQKYIWGSFLEKINEEIGETTSSEDKKLGFYFCKAKDGVITAERFVSKVLFYVYNDVFKDYGFEREFFQDENGKTMAFQSLYNVDGTVNEAKVAKILENLKVEVVQVVENDSRNDASDTDDSDDNNKGVMTVTYDGEVISEGNNLETYVKALEKIGVERIAALNITCYDQKIVGIEPPGNYAWRTVDGYKVLTFKIQRHAARLLKEVANGLNIDLTVSFE